MKNTILLLLLLTMVSVNSQTNKTIQTGIYKSNEKGQNFIFKINEDKTYEMAFFYGDYIIEKDTIRFKSISKNQGSFVVKPSVRNLNEDLLKIRFSEESISYYLSSIYLGTQKDESSEIIYKPLSEFIKLDENGLQTKKEIAISKTKYLYLVETKTEGVEISKFEISNDISEIEIEYNPYSIKNIELKGYIDSKTNQLAITDGKLPMLFTLEKQGDLPEKQSELDPKEIKTDKDFLKKYSPEINANEVALLSESGYKFKYISNKTFDEALKSIKSTPNKLLIVVFNLNDKNNNTDFDAFINSNEVAVSSYMYDKYNPEYDKFVFYLANKKDKYLLEKAKIKSDKELLFFNAQGDLLYHTPSTLTEKADFFSPYGSVSLELEKASQYIELDKVLTNKKASIPEIATALKQSLKVSISYDANYTAAAAIAPPVINNDKNTDTPETKTVEESAVTIDSAATAASDYSYDYSLIKDKQNVYALKTSRQTIDEKWKQVVTFYKNKNSFNKDFVQTLKSELEDEGFTRRLFNVEEKRLSDIDFEVLDYVFNNYKIIQESEKIIDTVNYQNNSKDIETILSSVFYNNTNLYDNPSKNQIGKVLKYYKQYLNHSENSFNSLQSYLTALKNNIDIIENKQEYLDVYEKYFNTVIKENSNIVEDLDRAYSSNNQSVNTDWLGFKNSFSSLANDVSWYVVEKIFDKSSIQKAINWSETSLKIEPNLHYYLDTLAQLYYKNGERQKAILTEQKAIDNVNDPSLEQNKEYEGVLEKMKKGTY